jgi:hypothetical protein
MELGVFPIPPLRRGFSLSIHPPLDDLIVLHHKGPVEIVVKLWVFVERLHRPPHRLDQELLSHSIGRQGRGVDR